MANGAAGWLHYTLIVRQRDGCRMTMAMTTPTPTPMMNSLGERRESIQQDAVYG